MREPSLQKTAVISVALHLIVFLITVLLLKQSSRFHDDRDFDPMVTLLVFNIGDTQHIVTPDKAKRLATPVSMML